MKCLILVCLVGSVTCAQKNLETDDARFPTGAIARLGTTRWRPGQDVEALAITPDGKTLAAAGYREIGLWDFATGEKIKSFVDDRYPALLAFADNGGTLISVNAGLLRYRDVRSGKIRHEVALVNSKDKDPYGSITRDGKFLAYKVDEPGTVSVWDLAARKEMRRIKSATYEFGCIGISPDGRMLALGRGPIEIWDAVANRLLHSLKLPEPTYLARLGFAPDGTLVSSGSHRHGTRSWNLKTGTTRTEFGWMPPESREFAFSDDGKLLATVSRDDKGYRLRVWDLAADREIRSWFLKNWCINSLLFTPDGRTLISAGLEPLIRFWDVAANKEIKKFVGGEGSPQNIVVSNDGRWLTTSNWTDGVILWNVNWRKPAARFAEASWYGVSAFSPDATHVVYTHADYSVRLCETATGKEVRVFDRHEKGTGESDKRNKEVTALAFDAGGETLFLSYADLTLRVRRISDGKVLRDHALAAPARIGSTMLYHRFSRNSRVLFEAEGKRFFDTATGKVLSVAAEARHLGHIYCGFDLSRDGKALVAMNQDASLLIQDVAAVNKTRTISRESKKDDNFRNLSPLALSPSGGLLAVRSVDGRNVEIWDLASGKLRHIITDNPGGVTSLAFVSEDIVAIGYQDTTILLWDVRVAGKKTVGFTGDPCE